MIVLLPGFPENVLAFTYGGHVTKVDVDDVLLPAVRVALKKAGGIRFYCEIEPSFSGFDPGLLWEDLTIGIGHLTRWERVAVVTDMKWLEHTTQFLNFVLPGQMKSFAIAESAKARAWTIAAAA